MEKRPITGEMGLTLAFLVCAILEENYAMVSCGVHFTASTSLVGLIMSHQIHKFTDEGLLVTILHFFGTDPANNYNIFHIARGFRPRIVCSTTGALELLSHNWADSWHFQFQRKKK